MDQKRTLDELNTLYALEPEVCDIYVEGSTDRYFVEWFLRRKGYNHVTVYPIDVVEIPPEVLAASHLPAGSNRAKVIALSYELAQQQVDKRPVMCIIDRDAEDACDCIVDNSYLFMTDGNALELYALTPAVMEKFVLVAMAGFPIAAGSLIQKITSILEAIFTIRRANERLNLGMQWIPFGKYIDIESTRITFREDDFIKAYLLKNSKWQCKEQFEAMIREVRSTPSTDITRRIRGHDLAELLQIVVRRFRKDRTFVSSAALEGCLMSSIEATDIETYPLFSALERHAVSCQKPLVNMLHG